MKGVLVRQFKSICRYVSPCQRALLNKPDELAGLLTIGNGNGEGGFVDKLLSISEAC